MDTLGFEWGTPVQTGQVRDKLQGKKYAIMAVVQSESSTGVLNPVPEIGKLLQGTDTLYRVDAETSLGGLEMRMDARGIDALLYSGTQKCLSCPPGRLDLAHRAYGPYRETGKCGPPHRSLEG